MLGQNPTIWTSIDVPESMSVPALLLSASLPKQMCLSSLPHKIVAFQQHLVWLYIFTLIFYWYTIFSALTIWSWASVLHLVLTWMAPALHLSRHLLEEFSLIWLSQGLMQVHCVACLHEECYQIVLLCQQLCWLHVFCSFPGLTRSVPMSISSCPDLRSAFNNSAKFM